jgi:hypothetical protein
VVTGGRGLAHRTSLTYAGSPGNSVSAAGPLRLIGRLICGRGIFCKLAWLAFVYRRAGEAMFAPKVPKDSRAVRRSAADRADDLAVPERSGGPAPGRPLSRAARAYFEPRFGHDFSRVRVYSDPSAAALGARAYTVGEAIVVNDAEPALTRPAGQHLLAHELAHVVQQRRGGAHGRAAGDPGLEAAARNAAREVMRGRSAAVAGAAAVGVACQPQAQGAAAGAPVGDAVRPSVEALLTAFAAASGGEKNRIGMQAVREVVQAYSFSTKGLAGMRYEPGMTAHDATTQSLGDGTRRSRIEFGPGTFNKGFEEFVHTVAHELEHVAQDLIGDYRQIPGDDTYAHPVQEFLSYSGSVLQVAPTPGRPGRGLLGELRAAPAAAPALPALPPEYLAGEANHALTAWQKMSAEEQQRYWPQFQAARDKLLQRISNDAPRALRPPPDQASPAFARWRDGVPSVYDPLSPDYDPDVAQSRWSAVKDQWKKFDAVRPPQASAASRPIGGVVP